MAWHTTYNPSDVEKGLQALALGRVLLRGNVAIGATTVTVGVGAAGTAGASDGCGLFRDTVTAAMLVQPNAAGTAIEDSEDVTIVNPSDSVINLTLTAPTTKAFTTARNAYITPKVLPTEVAALKVVDREPELMDDLTDLPLPSIHIRWLGDQCQHDDSQTEWLHRFRLRYIRQPSPGEASTVLLTKVQQIVNLLQEDEHWGGWVDAAWLRSVSPTPRPMNMIGLKGGPDLWLEWVDILLEARLEMTWKG